MAANQARELLQICSLSGDPGFISPPEAHGLALVPCS